MNTETLQERRFQASCLRAYWKSLIDEYLPTESQFHRWLASYIPEVVEFGIVRTSIKANKLRATKPMEPDFLLRYASACMRNKLAELRGETVVPRG
jgi:hypothetical protein